jgi:general stress protein 26
VSISKIVEVEIMWFFTKVFFCKVDEIEESKKVSIAIDNETSNNYLMIHGSATLAKDKTKMKDLYSCILKAWLPLGLKDPEMMLIKVTPN